MLFKKEVPSPKAVSAHKKNAQKNARSRIGKRWEL
eukprot:COSAG01_NODE_59_length_29986_cov_132.158597_11_plen_35_part_00